MAVSMHDVARRAGVSQRTVSNVVTGKVNVAPATRAKVEAAIAELGYRPNASARQLRTGRTSSITLAVPSLHERYFADLAEEVINEAGRRGLKVLVETTGGRHETELAHLRGTELLTDGLILAAISLTAQDESIPHPDFPIVLVGDRALRSGVDHVMADNRAAVRDAVGHLIGLGRRRIMLLGAALDARANPLVTQRLRIEGYTDALAAAGIALDPTLAVEIPWNQAEAGAAVGRLLAGPAALPDAIFAMNDSAALGAIRAIVGAGLRVPQDIAVIGFDDIQEGRWSVPTLSSVGPVPGEIARISLDLIAEQVSGRPREAVQARAAHVLQIRESTAGA